LKRDSEALDETVEEAVEGTVGEQLVRVIEARDEGEGGMIRPFLVIDLRSAVGKLRQSERSVPGLDEATDAASELASETKGTEQSQQDTGRGLLSSLFVAGVIIGLGYAMRKRGGSTQTSPQEKTERTAQEAAQQTESLAERAANTIQQRGEVAASRIEESTQAIAGRIEEGGQQTAEQIDRGGQQAAEKMDQTSDQLDQVESQAQEKAQNTKEKAQDKAENTKEKAQNKAEDAQEKADEATDESGAGNSGTSGDYEDDDNRL
jgi:paraquat-inducible protein B